MSHRLTLTELGARRCRACEPGMPPLDTATADLMLDVLPGWERAQGTSASGEIGKTFRFKNYYQTIAFVNAIAWMSHLENHHPDLVVGYNQCQVRYSTHTVGGLSENDFICAAKVEELTGTMSAD